jgi:hypothetical protein
VANTNRDPSLQFFEHNSKNLHMFHVKDGAFIKFETITLNIDFLIPKFSKSLTTHTGDIYLSGGTNEDSTKSPTIFKLNLLKQNLEIAGRLKVGRSSHAICYVKPYIVFIGGF